MIERVLVPVDDSDLATAGLTYVFENFPEAEITVLHVLDITAASNHIASGGRFEDWYSVAQSETKALLEKYRELADEYDISIETAHEVGDPATTILECAIDNEFDQIVIGSHSRHGLPRVFLGSVAETVARRSPVPVVIIHQNTNEE